MPRSDEATKRETHVGRGARGERARVRSSDRATERGGRCGTCTRLCTPAARTQLRSSRARTRIDRQSARRCHGRSNRAWR